MKLKSHFRYFIFTVLIIINIGLGCFQVAATNESSNDHIGDEELKLLVEQSQSFLNISSTQVRKYAYKALVLASAYEDTAFMAISTSYIGASFVMDQKYDTAFLLLFKAEKLAQSIHNNVILVRVYNNLASLFEMISDDKNAIKYYGLATELIQLNGLDYIYKPRLSLAKYYCTQGNVTLAEEIISNVIRDAHKNGDLVDEIRGHMNLLNSRLENHSIIYEDAQKSFDTIKGLCKKLDDHHINELLSNKEMIQLKLYQLNGDYKNVDSFSLKLLKDHSLDFNSRIKILKILLHSLKEESKFIQALQLQAQLDSVYNSEIFHLRTASAANNQALFELSNQKIIMDQIISDREIEKSDIKKKDFFFTISMIVNALFIMILIYFFYVLRMKKPKSYVNAIIEKPIGNLGNNELNKSFLHLFDMPAFVLNSDMIYQNANQKFIDLSGKEKIEALRGCNEFDMPWSDFGEKLHNYYKDVKIKKLPIFVEAKWFAHGQFEKVALFPLYDRLRFYGIIGIIFNSISEIEDGMIKNKQENEMRRSVIHEQDMLKRVLIVEDELDNIILIKRFLRDFEIDLVIAKSGEDAIDICKAQMFDTILLDLHFSGMSGMESLLEIRKINHFDKVKVFAMTASSKDELSEIELESFDDFIFKPLKKDILINKLSISPKK